MSWALLIFDSSWRPEAALSTESYYLQLQIPQTPHLLHMQRTTNQHLTADLDRLIDEAVPGRRGLDAWRALLEAHATLMRQLQTDLVNKTGLDLNDFDVISQLAEAGGELRMTELAARAFSSRSGPTRRVDRLLEKGLGRPTTPRGAARGARGRGTGAGGGRGPGT